jgi:hypothetical protein
MYLFYMWRSTGFSAWITNVPVLHVNVYRILSLNYKCTCFTCERLQDSQLELQMYVFYMWTSTGFSAWITNVPVLHVNVHRILSLNYKCTCFTCERPQDSQLELQMYVFYMWTSTGFSEICCRKDLKISKGYSEDANRRRTNNTMAKRKRTNNDI